MNEKKNCIIVGAGEFYGFVTKPDIEKDYIIAADGGYFHLQNENIEPDLIIGDLDSLEPELALEIQNKENVILLPKEKDDTDLLAAVKKGMEAGCQSFHIYGGTGGRFDHTIANIQTLHFIAKQNLQAFLYEKQSLITVLTDAGISFPKGATGTLSVFSLSEQSEGVTIRGMKYPLEMATLTNTYPIGISNEFTEEPGLVSVKKGSLLMIVS